MEKGVLPMNLLISVLEDCFVYANLGIAFTFILRSKNPLVRNVNGEFSHVTFELLVICMGKLSPLLGLLHGFFSFRTKAKEFHGQMKQEKEKNMKTAIVLGLLFELIGLFFSLKS